jgi:hypothetical protein
MAVGVGQPGPGGTRIVMPIGFFFIGRISPTCPYSSRGTCAAAPRPMSKREGRGADGGPRGWPLLPPAPHTASAHRVGVAAVDEHPRVDEHEQPPEEDHPARAARRARRGGDGGGGAESRGARAGACLGDTRQKVVMAPSSGTHDMACAFVGMSKIRSARVAYSLAYTHGGVRTCGQRPHEVCGAAQSSPGGRAGGAPRDARPRERPRPHRGCPTSAASAARPAPCSWPARASARGEAWLG